MSIQNHSKVTSNEDTYEFRAFKANVDSTGRLNEKKQVGTARIMNGQRYYTLKIWTFPWEEFFIVPQKRNDKRFSIFTREPNASRGGANQFKWHVVGSGTLELSKGSIVLKFDLFDCDIYLSIYSCRFLNRTNQTS